jgi:hypothetical protein
MMKTEAKHQPVHGKDVWTPSELAAREDWILQLTQEELKDIDNACGQIKSRGKSWGQFGKADFPLTALRERLEQIAAEIRNGRGFVLLRGLPVGRYTLDDTQTIYWGIASHLGSVVSQNAIGTTIGHVTDLKPANTDDVRYLRSYVTAKGQPPHCDWADVVGLLCVNKAKEGGKSAIASLTTIYNRIAIERPELVEPLFGRFFLDERGEGPTGHADETTEVAIPVFSSHGGRLRGFFHKQLMMQGSDKRGIVLSSLQREALEYVEQLGKDPTVRFEMDLQPGDIQFLNNHLAVHYRTAFVDGGAHKRLMLRMWLNLEPEEDLDPAYVYLRRGIPLRPWVTDKTRIAALGIG